MLELARRGRFARRARMRYTLVGCPPPSAPDTPLLLLSIPFPSTPPPDPRERSLSSSPPLPPHAQPAPPFPVPSLHHPPAGAAGVPRRSSPLGPAGGVSAGDPSGGGFLLGKDTIQLSSARAVCPFVERSFFLCRARNIDLFAAVCEPLNSLVPS